MKEKRRGTWDELESFFYQERASLILIEIEFKTGNDAFQARTFQTIESVANVLGRNFVTKILVTSLPVTEDEVQIRAKSSDISIISKDELPNVGTKLIEIAKKHTGLKSCSS